MPIFEILNNYQFSPPRKEFSVNKADLTEQLSVKALQGSGDMRAVVDAVMSAEQSLQAAVAIRDKIVSAYLEVTRMQI